MKECKYCGSFYADNLSACPNCGGSKIITVAEKAAEEKMYIKEIRNQEKSVPTPVETEKKRIPKLVIALGVTVVVVAIIIAVFAGRGSGNLNGNNANTPNTSSTPTSQIDATFEAGQKYYNTGNYEAAIGELSKVPVESEHFEDAQAMLTESVNKYRAAVLSVVSTYVQSNEYEKALSLIEEAQAVLPEDEELRTARNNTYDVYVDAVVIKASTYSQAGDYEIALSLIQNLQSDLPDNEILKAAYSETYTVYIDTMIAKADTYSQSADYETALGIIKAMQDKYPNDTRLEASYVTTYAAYKTVVCQNAISEADAYAANGDYVNAIQTLNAAVTKVGQDEAVSAKIKTYTESYKQDLFAAAKNAYYSDGYLAAITLLKNGQSVLGADQEITVLIEKYNNCRPISVVDLNCVYTNTGGFSSWNIEESMMGEEYTDYSNLLYHSAGYIDYKLLGDYKVISGSLIYNGSVTKVERTPTIKFYSDGTLIGTYNVTRNDRRVDFCLDISGTQYLRIEVEYMIAATYFGSFVDENFTMAGISEFYIYKDVIS